jgi:transposase-like protein
MNDLPETLLEAIEFFSDPDVCLDFMVSLRWPDGTIACPTCGSVEVGFLKTRKLWECKSKHERRQFSVKVGTIFEDSAVSLNKWLAAIWMIANDKNGVSSHEMHRALGVTQKTAWFMLHRIRRAMQTGSFQKSSGEHEVDETFIGGKARNMHRDRRNQAIEGTGGAGKAIVVGILQRHGGPGHSIVRATVAPNTRSSTLQPLIRENVETGSVVYTDAYSGYRGLSSQFLHEAIDHAETYVNGSVHTNGIENFWSLLKRAIHGTYISVEPFHLFRYIDEESFRFNNRGTTDAIRFLKVAAEIIGKRLTYKELTGATTTQ